MYSYGGRYKLGDRLAICDVCGFTFYLSELRKRWDGMMCCDVDWELKPDRDAPYVRPEQPKYVVGRPEPEDRFLDVNEVTRDDL